MAKRLRWQVCGEALENVDQLPRMLAQMRIGHRVGDNLLKQHDGKVRRAMTSIFHMRGQVSQGASQNLDRRLLSVCIQIVHVHCLDK